MRLLQQVEFHSCALLASLIRWSMNLILVSSQPPTNVLRWLAVEVVENQLPHVTGDHSAAFALCNNTREESAIDAVPSRLWRKDMTARAKLSHHRLIPVSSRERTGTAST